ncbi:MAG: nuclear transport factor 2 family protein [Longimicrobiales bacterium]
MRQERGSISVSASILIAFLVPVSLSAQTPQCEKVFEYILPEWEGMAVGASGYQIWIQTRKDRAHPAADPPTIEERAALYSALNTGAVASDCDGSRGHVRYLFSHDPSLRGWRFSYDYKSDGQTQRFWILDSAGHRGQEQQARELEPREYGPGDACAALEGAWEYVWEGREGMFIQNGGYAAGVYSREERLPLDSDASADEQAAALEGTSGFATTYTCAGPRMEMAILHSSDPREEGDTISADFRVSGDTLRWWLLTEEGQRGPEQIARRLRPGDPAMEIRALLGALDRAQNAGDLDAFLELVDDGIVYMPPDGPAVVGKAANAEFYRRMFDQVDLRIRHIPEQTFRDGALVVTRGRAIGTMQAGGADAIPFDNKYLYVLREGEDGLRLVQVMYNAGPS